MVAFERSLGVARVDDYDSLPIKSTPTSTSTMSMTVAITELSTTTNSSFDTKTTTTTTISTRTVELSSIAVSSTSTTVGIVVGVIGALLVIAAIVGVVVWLQRRKQGRRDEASQSVAVVVAGEKFVPAPSGGAYEVGPMHQFGERVAAVDGGGDYELAPISLN